MGFVTWAIDLPLIIFFPDIQGYIVSTVTWVEDLAHLIYHKGDSWVGSQMESSPISPTHLEPPLFQPRRLLGSLEPVMYGRWLARIDAFAHKPHDHIVRFGTASGGPSLFACRPSGRSELVVSDLEPLLLLIDASDVCVDGQLLEGPWKLKFSACTFIGQFMRLLYSNDSACVNGSGIPSITLIPLQSAKGT